MNLLKNKNFIFSVILLVKVGFTLISTQVFFDNSTWLPPDNKYHLDKNYVYEEFDRGENFIVAVEIPDNFFQDKYLEALKRIRPKIEEIDKVIEVKDPLATTTIIQKNGEMNVLTFEEAIDRNIIESNQQYKELFSNNDYFGILVSKDYKKFVINIKVDAPVNIPEEEKIDSKAETRRNVIAIVKTIMQGEPLFQNFRFAGEGILYYALTEASKKNLVALLPISIAFIFLLLYYMYRQLGKILIIANISFSVIVVTLSAFVWTSSPLDIVGISLPITILVIAIADSIHILNRWDELKLKIPDKMECAVATLKQTWFPCLMTTLTTSIGYGSFYFAELKPLSNFGLNSFIAILFAYAIIISDLFAILYFFPRLLKSRKEVVHNFLIKILDKSAQWSLQYKKQFFVSAMVLLGLSLICTYFHENRN